MYTVLARLLDELNGSKLSGADVIEWGSPVPSFGDSSLARVATLGINPSNREFVDERGVELEGRLRRFHTLNSLGLGTWADADCRHLSLMLESYCGYFVRNPYDIWFKRLDYVIAGLGVSFYNEFSSACHLDVVPYATNRKWTALTQGQRLMLLRRGGEVLGTLLRDSPVRVLILNGKSVVDQFETVSDLELQRLPMRGWNLARERGAAVSGLAFQGLARVVGGVKLYEPVLVLGYNHNLQSSFGVTKKVINAIRDWITRTAAEVIGM